MISATGFSNVPVLFPSGSGARPAAAANVPNLRDAWETTHRGLQEKILAERLDTVEKIANALTPLMVNAYTGGTARSVAGTLDVLGREMEAIVRQMGGELNRQRRSAAAGGGAVSSGFHGLIAKTEWNLRRVAGMLLAVSASDEAPLPGRKTAREIAFGAATPLRAAWGTLDSLKARFAGMGISRVDMTA